MTSLPSVWIFHGEEARFAAGVFASETEGTAWASRQGVTGLLTEYLVGNGCYDLAVESGSFKPTKPHHGTPTHVAGFSPGLRHVHITHGSPDAQPSVDRDEERADDGDEPAP